MGKETPFFFSPPDSFHWHTVVLLDEEAFAFDYPLTLNAYIIDILFQSLDCLLFSLLVRVGVNQACAELAVAEKLGHCDKINPVADEFRCEVMAQEMEMEIDPGFFSYLADRPSEQIGLVAVWNVEHPFDFFRLPR